MYENTSNILYVIRNGNASNEGRSREFDFNESLALRNEEKREHFSDNRSRRNALGERERDRERASSGK